MSRFNTSLIAAAIAQACALAPAFAQTVQNDDAPENVLPAVTVIAAPDDGGKAATASVGGFGETPLLETPASVSVITQQQMQDRNIRSTTAAVETDASVNDAYNAVGYAEQFSIRGFTLENETSFRKDGLSFSGASSVPLENKERIEILKGLSGLQAGVATPGGIINYVTKRPTETPVRTLTTEFSERGTAYGAIDLGGMSEDKRFGYRINAATETINSYVKGADGNRNFVSGAFDWHLTDRALLQLDMDYQHKSQITAPGYQLLGGTDVPSHVDPKRLLGDAPWVTPVTDDTSNIGLRFKYNIDNNWHVTLGANRYELKRDDHSAFPYGCAAQLGWDPGYCSNGDYDVYDYRSDDQRYRIVSTQVLLQGKAQTGTIAHDLTFGADTMRRRDSFGEEVYDFVGTNNIYDPRLIPSRSPRESGPVSLRRKDDEQSFFVQDILTLSQRVKLHAGLRYTELKREQFDAAGTQTSDYDRSYLLPNIALVVTPQPGMSIYGAYSQGLQHGGIAPEGTSNEDQMLNPNKSHQVEIGFKQDLSNTLSFTASLFQIKAPLEYVDYRNSPTGEFVQNGDAVHRGIELGLTGRVTRQLLAGVSLTALDAKQKNTGDPALDDKRNVNVPKLKTVAFLDYAVADVPGLNLNTTLTYAGSKAFDTQNETIVGGYSVVDAGARYATRIGNTPVRFNFTVYNVFDKFYWRDVTQGLGGYLFPGAPRTFKLTAQFDF
ncbi:TonB-dependent receptor [Oxalicibacterium solurbis]|uniref:TonB-dependent receptor n=2 Tax=Oxalicibacterium solurbis TaxID=69280 RepID=A0A8J3FA17_9BURK|nr:TonB-dependent siderophore receptor [Oxalicibacterium solurbis]GGI55218.1 TonB-dependent receptor [Oxalicibacterium solurbis]